MSSCLDLKNQLAKCHQLLREKAEQIKELSVSGQQEPLVLNEQLTTEMEQKVLQLKQLIRGLNYVGNLNLSHIEDHRQLQESNGFIFPHLIHGNLKLSKLTYAEGLVLPDEMRGSLFLTNVSSTKGLMLPNEIGDDLDLYGLTSAEGLVLPNKIGGNLYLHGLTSADYLVLPEIVGGKVVISMKIYQQVTQQLTSAQLEKYKFNLIM